MQPNHRVSDLTGGIHREKLAKRDRLGSDFGAKYEPWGIVLYFTVLGVACAALVYFYL